MIGLLISLFLILLAAEGFTNGVEAFSKKHSISQAVAGSILAAVGTALPETILPIVAILFGSHSAGKEIGVGAILGAPFMLATIAFFVTGVAVVVSYLSGKRKFEVKVENETIKRDLTFFVVMYSMAVIIPLVIGKSLNTMLAVILVAGYIYYVKKTAQSESGEIEHSEGLHIFNFAKKMNLFSSESPSSFLIIFQVLLTLIIMVSGAHLFVKNLEIISLKYGMSPMLFALILAPIATELPEKFNSITWTLKGKDSLAFGNITGAMVFQSTFPVSVGLLLTNWQLTPMALLSAGLAIISAVIMLIQIYVNKKITPHAMLFGGVLYVFYLVVLILR